MIPSSFPKSAWSSRLERVHCLVFATVTMARETTTRRTRRRRAVDWFAPLLLVPMACGGGTSTGEPVKDATSMPDIPPDLATTDGPFAPDAPFDQAHAIDGVPISDAFLGALSTEFGRSSWSDYAVIEPIPSGDILLSTWTHVVQSGPSSNDYPFIVGCGPNPLVTGCVNDAITCVAGNVGPYTPYYYNVNTMSCDGDHDTVYAICTDEQAHGWVFVAWHIAHGPGTTTIRQYLKFGTAGDVAQVNPMEGTETRNRVYDTLSLTVGGSAREWATTWQMYARVHEMGVPTVDQVDEIALDPNPDPSAWADWSLIAGDLTDRSGHGHHLTLQGAVYPGNPGPF